LGFIQIKLVNVRVFGILAETSKVVGPGSNLKVDFG